MYVLICYDQDCPENTSMFFFKSLSSAFSKLQSFSDDVDYRDLAVNEVYSGYPYSYEIKPIEFEEDED